MKEVVFNNLKFFSNYKKSLEYLKEENIEVIDNKFNYTFFDKHDSIVTINRLYPRYLNRCNIEIRFKSNDSYEEIQSLLEEDFGEDCFCNYSNFFFWNTKNYQLYHSLTEERSGNLLHIVVLFEKPILMSLLPKKDYNILYRMMVRLSYEFRINLIRMNSSYVLFQEDEFYYAIMFDKKNIRLHLRKKNQTDNGIIIESHIKTFIRKLRSEEDLGDWQVIVRLLDEAKEYVYDNYTGLKYKERND